MSHFSVLVVGPSNEDELERALRPFNEQDPELYEFIDKHDDVLAEFESAPKEVKAEYPTFVDYASDYCGLEERDGRFGSLRNPNAKWDWWALGGRWTGFLPILPATVGARRGRPGLMTPQAPFGQADMCRKCDIDVPRAMAVAEREALERWHQWQALYSEHAFERVHPWSFYLEALVKHESVTGESNPELLESLRRKYAAQPLVIAAQKVPLFRWTCPIDEYGFDRERYVDRVKRSQLVTFAVLTQCGTWHERATMRAFGYASGADPDWDARWWALFNDIPDETVVSVVDCHI